ncbi:LysR family transcriptional regulator [Paraburkholderia sp. MMS20-SJTR3]|uniref:LysR family transcriptional regulator n=1 Tax=Paraburkholderia sejongensis TaxID=2886946 RepID=A0ABS8K0D8_9BURK|nr:LysR substrate-binding domain-containing protein [Paraburkholderia sp. MMS20-SJTR3]MCC8395615.1 LysR family transcriptional regulator [Paraburkholderia sp. MMS20-SJTR3]
MSSIDHFNLWSFDLNLLVAFDALMRERSVTRAASRLKIQQSAMSHNLGTLRVLLDDELFVRVGQVMKPTSRAQALAAAINRILEQAQHAITTREKFCPEEEERTFSIAFSSELEVLSMPGLTAQLQRCAPGIKLLARPAQPNEVHRMLDEGAIDLGVGCFGEGAERHRWKLLFEQSLMCCFNPALLDLALPISRSAYLAQKHAMVSQNASIRGCLEDAVRAAGVELDMAMAAPEFLTVLSTVMHAPVIATLPSRIVSRYAPLMGLVASPVPFDFAVTPISMVWAAHSDRDPASEWLRQQIEPILAQIEGITPSPGLVDMAEVP